MTGMVACVTIYPSHDSDRKQQKACADWQKGVGSALASFSLNKEVKRTNIAGKKMNNKKKKSKKGL